MRRFLALALALVLVPAVAAQSMSADVTFAADFTSMMMAATVEMDGETSASMRQTFDDVGNGDGQATQQEADDFMEEFADDMEEAASETMDPADMQLDGNAATAIQITRVAVRNAAGPISSQTPILLDMDLEATLRPGPGPKHTLVMTGETEEDNNMTGIIRIRAPVGYIIESHNAGAAGSLSSDMRTLTVDSELADDTEEDSQVVFAPESNESESTPPPTSSSRSTTSKRTTSKAAPGVDALAYLAALGIAVMLGRKQR